MQLVCVRQWAQRKTSTTLFCQLFVSFLSEKNAGSLARPPPFPSHTSALSLSARQSLRRAIIRLIVRDLVCFLRIHKHGLGDLLLLHYE